MAYKPSENVGRVVVGQQRKEVTLGKVKMAREEGESGSLRHLDLCHCWRAFPKASDGGR